MSIFGHNGSKVGHVALGTTTASLIYQQVVLINANAPHFCRGGMVRSIDKCVSSPDRGPCVGYESHLHIEWDDGNINSVPFRDVLVVTR